MAPGRIDDRPGRLARALVLGALPCLCAWTAVARADEPGLRHVVLQLRFDHQFQFAGYYAAAWQGHYRDAGLEVEIRPGLRPDGSVVDVTAELAGGAATFGVAAGDALIARGEGVPLVLLASIFQHSAVELYSWPDAGVRSPADLAGLRVQSGNHPLLDVEYRAMLEAEGVPAAMAPLLPVPAPGSVENHFGRLFEREVDASLAYSLSILWHARERGLRFDRLRPSSYGIDFYGDSLFAHDRTVEGDPALVEAFVVASLAGWRHALANPEETADRIAAELPRTLPLDDAGAYNRFLVPLVTELTLYPVVEPGHVNPLRWERMHEALVRAGLAGGTLDLERFVFDPVARRDRAERERNERILVAAAALASLLLLIVILQRWHINSEQRRAYRELTAGEQRIREITENIREIFWAKDPASGRLLYVSSAYADIWGRDPHELQDRPDAWLELVHPEDRERMRTVDRERESEAVQDQTYRIRRDDGSERWIRERSFPVRAPDGSVQRIVGVADDVTELRRHQRRIERLTRLHRVHAEVNAEIARTRDRHALLQAVCRIAVEDGGFAFGWIAVLDSEEQRLRGVAWYGEGAESLPISGFAVGEEHPERNGVAARAALGGRRAVDNDFSRHLDVGPIRQQLVDMGLLSGIGLPLHVRGQVVAVLVLLAAERGFFDDGEVHVLDNLAADLALALELIDHSDQAAFLARHDPLTGLPNTAFAIERLGHWLDPDGRRTVALALLDVEHFAAINDGYGRAVGDQVLRELAERLKRAEFSFDLPARVGDDVFAVTLRDFPDVATIARLLRERIPAVCAQPIAVPGRELRVSLSVGIAVFPGDGRDPETLFRNAEAAKRRAKRTGDRVVFYKPELNAHVSDLLDLERRLRRAVAQGDFTLHYQPKVTLDGRDLTGLEALLRWQDPERGTIPPVEFVSMLEDSGLIVEVGAWVMETAVKQRADWFRAGLPAPRIAVNVSPKQLRDADFVGLVQGITGGRDDAGLDLEITESLIMEDLDRHAGLLRSLKDQGVRIAIDDFGTGHSSLSYLSRLPVQALKIDRSFVNGVTERPDLQSIVSAILALSRSLNLTSIAEGVETEDQERLLRLLGCDEMQGYVYARPMPAEALARFLVDR